MMVKVQINDKIDKEKYLKDKNNKLQNWYLKCKNNMIHYFKEELNLENL